MENKKSVVLITGAAGGLGMALSEKFLAMGWKVAAADLILPDMPGVAAVRERSADFLPLVMDVTSGESVAHAGDVFSSAFGRLDLIVNNAGIDRYMLLSEALTDDFKEVFEVNVFGAQRVNWVFLPMMTSPGGRIIFIGSESLNLALPFMPYPLSKKLLEGYARALRQELRFRGIEVTVVRPGAIQTKILQSLSSIKSFSASETSANRVKAAFNAFVSQAAAEVGHVTAPEDVASLVYRAAVCKKPAAVYRINNMLKLRIAALLPFSLTERVVFRKLSKGLK
jgi:NAD(P)-dependent dehydrogenase (short-subunit alcohol dehydrogenase family)